MRITSLQVNCDNESCNYSCEVQQNEITSWINKPCPDCNENLFTYDDYEKTMAMIELASDLETLTTVHRVPTHDSQGDPIQLRMSCDREGKVLITDKAIQEAL